jgi:hypothetical protein
VTGAYEEQLAALGPELQILMDAPSKDIKRAGGRLLAEAVDRMRESKVIRKEGYDGEYGVIRLFKESEKATLRGQTALFEAPSETALDEEERRGRLFFLVGQHGQFIKIRNLTRPFSLTRSLIRSIRRKRSPGHHLPRASASWSGKEIQTTYCGSEQPRRGCA